MVWINPLIAVSLKTRLPEGYCSACARWARLFVATGVAFALTLGPAIAACSYISFYFLFLYKLNICLILLHKLLKKYVWDIKFVDNYKHFS